MVVSCEPVFARRRVLAPLVRGTWCVPGVEVSKSHRSWGGEVVHRPTVVSRWGGTWLGGCA
ncbi:hypothetical protein CEP80_12485 [Jonesia denitrificans]|nr:hypothetical protein CEP80_12485 [Jonesia denitrificans]